MILKENFDPRKVVSYIWRDLVIATASATTAYTLAEFAHLKAIMLPFAPIGVLGTALAIFLAFRNNTSFSRWWEASTLWQTIHTQSRIFARLILTFVNSHQHLPAYNPERAQGFQQRMIRRQIAWANALRLQLRNQATWDELRPWIGEEEHHALLRHHNKPAFLMLQQGKDIYDAMANGTLMGFDSFQLEGALAQLSAQQGLCERIKSTPVPRQYDYFTRLFVHIFIILLPFCLLGLFTSGFLWQVIPFSVLLASIFSILERTGAVNEHPFENRITDVPLTAICRNIERDLLDTLGQESLPPILAPKDGYLF